MGILRYVVAYCAAVAVQFVAGGFFYTQQVLAKQFAVGAVYTPAQQLEAYLANYAGLAPLYGAVMAIALLLGFLVASVAKRVLKPLAPIAYPIAGAAAVAAAILLIENTAAAGGAGAIGGARDALGLGLQAASGALGGLVFALLRPKRA